MHVAAKVKTFFPSIKWYKVHLLKRSSLRNVQKAKENFTYFPVKIFIFYDGIHFTIKINQSINQSKFA